MDSASELFDSTVTRRPRSTAAAAPLDAAAQALVAEMRSIAQRFRESSEASRQEMRLMTQRITESIAGRCSEFSFGSAPAIDSSGMDSTVDFSIFRDSRRPRSAAVTPRDERSHGWESCEVGHGWEGPALAASGFAWYNGSGSTPTTPIHPAAAAAAADVFHLGTEPVYDVYGDDDIFHHDRAPIYDQYNDEDGVPIGRDPVYDQYGDDGDDVCVGSDVFVRDADHGLLGESKEAGHISSEMDKVLGGSLYAPSPADAVEAEPHSVHYGMTANCSMDCPSQVVINMVPAAEYDFDTPLQGNFSTAMPTPFGVEDVRGRADSIGCIHGTALGTPSPATAIWMARDTVTVGTALNFHPTVSYSDVVVLWEPTVKWSKWQPWPPPTLVYIICSKTAIRPAPWPSYTSGNDGSASKLCSNTSELSSWIWKPPWLLLTNYRRPSCNSILCQEAECYSLKTYGRARGLCLQYVEFWVQNPIWSSQIQLQALLEIWDVLESDHGSEPEPEAEASTEQVFMALSQAAWVGKKTPKPLQLHGYIQNHHVSILLDSGSTNSFISDKFLSVLYGFSVLSRAMRIMVATGETVSCSYQLVDAVWSVQDCEFTFTLRAMPISAYDLVIGMDWLARFSPLLIDWDHQWLCIHYHGSWVMLCGVAVVPSVTLEPLLNLHDDSIDDTASWSLDVYGKMSAALVRDYSSAKFSYSVWFQLCFFFHMIILLMAYWMPYWMVFFSLMVYLSILFWHSGIIATGIQHQALVWFPIARLGYFNIIVNLCQIASHPFKHRFYCPFMKLIVYSYVLCVCIVSGQQPGILPTKDWHLISGVFIDGAVSVGPCCIFYLVHILVLWIISQAGNIVTRIRKRWSCTMVFLDTSLALWKIVAMLQTVLHQAVHGDMLLLKREGMSGASSLIRKREAGKAPSRSVSCVSTVQRAWVMRCTDLGRVLSYCIYK